MSFSISETFKNAAVREANACYKVEIPELPDELYGEFAITGNRVHYEAACFLRRRLLNRLVLGEVCEGKGHFLPEIENIIALTLAEKTWVLPAHSDGKLPSGAEENMDLFSTQTAAALAITSELLPLSPNTQLALWRTIDQRIFQPFLIHNYWWRDLGSNRRPSPSNWTPWCIHGVMECVRAARAVKPSDIDPEVLNQIWDSCLVSVNHYFEDYPDDGGCDEGSQYWEHSVGHFFECGVTELLAETGKILRSKKLSAMYSFLEKVHLTGNYYMNFADCAARISPNASMLFLMGKEIGDTSLQAFGAFLYHCNLSKKMPTTDFDLFSKEPDITLRDDMDLRAVLNAAIASPEIEVFPTKLSHKNREYFASLNAGVFRGVHFCAAAKGGHNEENHNHNDCGNIILYADGKPLFIDVGVGAYTKDTFSDRRYTIWTMQSSFHNLPEVNGCMQKDGTQYFAEKTEFFDSGFSCDIAKAYPEETGLLSLQRTLKLAKSTVEIISDFEFVSERDPNTIFLNYMMASAPILVDGHILLFEDYTIVLPPAEWNVEKIEFGEDEKLSPVWGSTVYRLRGKISASQNKFTAVTTIHRSSFQNKFTDTASCCVSGENTNSTSSEPDDKYFMEMAIEEAEKAIPNGDVPIGCVLVKDGKVISSAYNRRNLDHSVLSHAEMLAIEQAAKNQGDFRLDGYTMYVTLEPCQMCAGAIIQSRIERVVIGAMNKKAGCAGSVLNLLQVPRFNHQAKITSGVCSEECSALLENFFRTIRASKQNNKEEL